jgi:hypothetical protein
MAPQLAGLNATMEGVSADLAKNSGIDEVARRISAQLVDSNVMEKISRGWATALSDSIALKPETLTAIRETQRAVTRG